MSHICVSFFKWHQFKSRIFRKEADAANFNCGRVESLESNAHLANSVVCCNFYFPILYFSQILNFQNYFQWLLEDFRRLILGISGGLKGGMRDKDTGELKIYVPKWKPDSGGGGSGSGGGCCGGCVILWCARRNFSYKI